MILASAIWYSGRAYSVPKPGRHHDVIALMREMPMGDYFDCSNQGFITDTGIFVSREVAWHIAKEAGQIIHRCGGDDADGGTLYSENLW